MVRDFAGRGLVQTQLYKLLGPLIYPIFYGAAVFALWRLMALLRQRATYLMASPHAVFVAGKRIPAETITGVRVRKNWLGVRELVFDRRNTVPLAIRTYILSETAYEALHRVTKTLRLAC